MISAKRICALAAVALCAGIFYWNDARTTTTIAAATEKITSAAFAPILPLSPPSPSTAAAASPAVAILSSSSSPPAPAQDYKAGNLLFQGTVPVYPKLENAPSAPPSDMIATAAPLPDAATPVASKEGEGDDDETTTTNNNDINEGLPLALANEGTLQMMTMVS
jgi:hypothetical protein